MFLPGTGISLPPYTAAQLWTLLGLILANVLLAVAHAIKIGAFEWGKLLEFYEKALVPYLIGWFALRVMMLFVDTSQLGEFGKYGTETAVQLAYARVVWLVGSKILANLKDLYGEFSPAGARARARVADVRDREDDS